MPKGQGKDADSRRRRLDRAPDPSVEVRSLTFNVAFGFELRLRVIYPVGDCRSGRPAVSYVPWDRKIYP